LQPVLSTVQTTIELVAMARHFWIRRVSTRLSAKSFRQEKVNLCKWLLRATNRFWIPIWTIYICSNTPLISEVHK